MRTISYRAEDLKKVVIELGFVGENEHTQVIIDCTKTFAEYPEAVPTMKVQPPKGTAYPRTVTREGNCVIWTVMDGDLAERGRGEIQLTFTNGTKICKTYVGKTNISRSIVGSGPVPSGIQDFLDEANEALENLESAEVHQPIIDDNGYWNTWDQETGEYVATETKAQGEDGQDGQDGQDGTDATPDLITKDYADLTFPVAKDSFCYHDGKLYQAKQDIQTSEAWTAAHWQETTVEAQLSTVKSALQAIAVTPESFGAKGDGVTDDSEAVQAAVNSGYEVHFKDNKTYYLASTVTISNDTRLIGGRNTKIKTVSSEGSLNTAFTVSSTLKKETTLTSDYKETGSGDNAANRFTLDDMTNIEIGDLMEITAEDQYYSYARQYYYLGGVMLISNIDSGHLYTCDSLPFDIDLSDDVTVKIYSPVTVSFENLHFVSDKAQVGFRYFINFMRGKNCSIKNCTAENIWNSFRFYHCYGSVVDGLQTSLSKYDNSLYYDSYGMCIESCTNTIIQRVNGINAQGCVELTGTIPVIDTYIKNCNLGAECRTVGIDAHENTYNLVIEDCNLGGLSLYGTATVNRCRIYKNLRTGSDFGIAIRGSHDERYARFKITNCILYNSATAFISITNLVPQTPIQNFDCVFGEILIENCENGFLRMDLSNAPASILSNTVKKISIKNWKNCAEIYRKECPVQHMEVINTMFTERYWMNQHTAAFYKDGVSYLHYVNDDPRIDRVYYDEKQHGIKTIIPGNLSISVSSSNASARHTVCGKNIMSNDKDDFSVGSETATVGGNLTRTPDTTFANALSIQDGCIVFTQPNSTNKRFIYPKYFAYVEENGTAKMECTLKNIGETSGSTFYNYVTIIDSKTGKVKSSASFSSKTATADGALLSLSVAVQKGDIISLYLRCSNPVQYSVTKIENWSAYLVPAGVLTPAFMEYDGSSIVGDGTLLSVDGVNNIMSSEYVFNTNFRADLLED